MSARLGWERPISGTGKKRHDCEGATGQKEMRFRLGRKRRTTMCRRLASVVKGEFQGELSLFGLERDGHHRSARDMSQSVVVTQDNGWCGALESH